MRTKSFYHFEPLEKRSKFKALNTKDISALVDMTNKIRCHFDLVEKSKSSVQTPNKTTDISARTDAIGLFLRFDIRKRYDKIFPADSADIRRINQRKSARFAGEKFPPPYPPTYVSVSTNPKGELT